MDCSVTHACLWGNSPACDYLASPLARISRQNSEFGSVSGIGGVPAAAAADAVSLTLGFLGAEGSEHALRQSAAAAPGSGEVGSWRLGAGGAGAGTRAEKRRWTVELQIDVDGAVKGDRSGLLGFVAPDASPAHPAKPLSPHAPPPESSKGAGAPRPVIAGNDFVTDPTPRLVTILSGVEESFSEGAGAAVQQQPVSSDGSLGSGMGFLRDRRESDNSSGSEASSLLPPVVAPDDAADQRLRQLRYWRQGGHRRAFRYTQP